MSRRTFMHALLMLACDVTLLCIECDSSVGPERYDVAHLRGRRHTCDRTKMSVREALEKARVHLEQVKHAHAIR